MEQIRPLRDVLREQGLWDEEDPENPAQDMDAAWRLVERLRKRKWDFAMMNDERGIWVATFDKIVEPSPATAPESVGTYFGLGRANNAPIAIVRAALSRRKVEQVKEGEGKE